MNFEAFELLFDKFFAALGFLKLHIGHTQLGYQRLDLLSQSNYSSFFFARETLIISIIIIVASFRSLRERDEEESK